MSDPNSRAAQPYYSLEESRRIFAAFICDKCSSIEDANGQRCYAASEAEPDIACKACMDYTEGKVAGCSDREGMGMVTQALRMYADDSWKQSAPEANTL